MKIATLIFFALVFAGCATPPPPDYVPTVPDFFLETSNDPRGMAVTLPRSGVKLLVARTPVFLAGDIVNVELMQVDLGRCLMFQLTPAAARDLYRVSAANQGRRLVLTINGAPFGARQLEAPLTNGQIFVFVEMPDAALPALVANMKRTTSDLQRAIAKKK